MTTAGYLRVGHGCPLSIDAQREAVLDRARRDGLTVARLYSDVRPKGGEGRAALLRSIEEGRVSTVVTVSICRLAPTWPSLLRVLSVIAEARVALLVANDDSERGAEAVMRAVPALVAVRSTLHREAAAAGRAKAKARGVQFGRPRIVDAKIVRVREALDAGAGVREAARRAGVSPATVLRVCR